MSGARCKTQSEYDRLAREIGHDKAAREFPYTLVYQYAGGGHEWVMYFSTERARQEFREALRPFANVTGASGGDVSGLAR